MYMRKECKKCALPLALYVWKCAVPLLLPQVPLRPGSSLPSSLLTLLTPLQVQVQKTQQCHQEVHLWNKFTLKRARNMQDKTVHALLCKPGIAVYKVVFSPTSEIPIKTLKALCQNHCIDTFTSKQNQLTGSPQINPLINSHTCLQGYPLILLRAWATVKHPARSGRSNKPRSWSYSHTDNPFCK